MPPIASPTLATTTTKPVASPSAHGVRIPSAVDSSDRVASVLIALETGNAASFRLDARAERNLYQPEFRPTVRMVLDDWCWFLKTEEAALVALGLRMDCEVLGGPNLTQAQRIRITELVADAFEAAVREAEALAALRNAAGPGDPVPLFLERADAAVAAS